MQAPPISEQQVEEALQWIDSIHLSRTPKNLSRDFSDGVLVAEVMHSNYPNQVHLHNYQPTNSSASKYINWKTLNEKVFRKLNFQIHRNDIEAVIAASPGAIERVLYQIYSRVSNETHKTIISSPKLQPSSMLKTSHRPSESIRTSMKSNPKIDLTPHDYTQELSCRLADREAVIRELQQTIQMMSTKFRKMEQLNRLKDAKIDSLMKKLDENIGI